jgi:hypothetical protein
MTSKAAREFVARHIRKHRKEGMPPKQAVAVAYAEAREKGYDVPSKPNPHIGPLNIDTIGESILDAFRRRKR